MCLEPALRFAAQQVRRAILTSLL